MTTRLVIRLLVGLVGPVGLCPLLWIGNIFFPHGLGVHFLILKENMELAVDQQEVERVARGQATLAHAEGAVAAIKRGIPFRICVRVGGGGWQQRGHGSPKNLVR